MYYQAKARALANGQSYHLAAILFRKKRVVAIGVNSAKTHPAYVRTFSDGTTAACMHAEMSALRRAQPGDVLRVLRVLKNGCLTMAKPCEHCENLIHASHLAGCYYTNWRGEWVVLERSEQ